MEIKTERLVITQFNEDMAEQVSKLSLDEDNRKFLPDEVFETTEDALDTIRALIELYDDDEGPYVYPILLDGKNIGHVELVPVRYGYEVGYHIGKDFTGNGYATEALQEFLKFVKKNKKLNKVSGICRQDNEASKRVLQKCGFVLACEVMDNYHGEETMIYKFNKYLK